MAPRLLALPALAWRGPRAACEERPPRQKPRVVVVGAGLTGCLTAALLRRSASNRNLEIEVWERATYPSGRFGAGFAFQDHWADMGAQVLSVVEVDSGHPNAGADGHGLQTEALRCAWREVQALQARGELVRAPDEMLGDTEERMKYEGLWAHFWAPLGFAALLRRYLAEAQAALHCRRRAERVTCKTWSARARVESEGVQVEADVVVLAVPAPEARRLLATAAAADADAALKALGALGYDARRAAALALDHAAYPLVAGAFEDHAELTVEDMGHGDPMLLVVHSEACSTALHMGGCAESEGFLQEALGAVRRLVGFPVEELLLGSRVIDWSCCQMVRPLESVPTSFSLWAPCSVHGRVVVAGDFWSQSSFLGCFCSAQAAARQERGGVLKASGHRVWPLHGLWFLVRIRHFGSRIEGPRHMDRPSEEQALANAVYTERLVQWLAAMRLMGMKQPRVVTAGRAMRAIAQPKRAAIHGYQYSYETNKQLQEFWSHSWQTPAWKKALTLFLRYNGLAAAIAGTLGAAVPFGLSCFDLIPGYTKQPWRGPLVEIAPWCLLTGALLFCIVVCLWRSQRIVWVDLLCIHQTDLKLKQMGLMSFGGVIKSAKGMLVVWDETWVERLWCIYELAAFMKSHGEEAKQHLLIVPTFCGTFWVAQFGLAFLIMLGNVVLPFDNVIVIVVGLVGLLANAIVLEMLVFDFYSQVDTLDARLRCFSLKDVKCSCCTNNHTDADGQPVGCDRSILLQCMCHWFGSEDACESIISSTVRDAVREKLGRFPWSYWAMLSTFMPVWWAYMDHTAARIREERWLQAGAVVVNFLAWCFNILPAVLTFTIAMVRKTHAGSKSQMRYRWLCRITNILFHLLAQSCDRLTLFLIPDDKLLSEALLLAVSLFPAIGAWRLRRIS
ncbi:unnamed protein product [Effrenium voratum]|nr:unnamed protein product [Effrenium voratum]